MRIAHPIRFIRSAMKDRPAGRRWHSRAACCVIAAAGFIHHASPANAQIPCRYEVSAIIQAPRCPFTGPPPTIGTGISPNGRYVCGYWYQCDTGYKAFLFDTTTLQFTTLPFPAGVVSMTAAAVNDSAIVVGQMENTLAQQRQGFIWNSQSAQYTALVPLSSHGWAAANAINSAGTVCGFRSIGSPNDPIFPYQAYIWSADVYTDLGVMDGPNSEAFGISDAGVCVGGTGGYPPVASIDGSRAFVFANGMLTVLPPVPDGTTSSAKSADGTGRVLAEGIIQRAPLLVRAFIYDLGAWQEILPAPGFDRSFAATLQDNGTVAGTCSASANPQVAHATIWSGQSVALVENLIEGAGIETTEISIGMAADGRLLVRGKVPGGNPRCRLLTPHYRIPGDADCNDIVNIDDLLHVITSWGPCRGCAGDFTQDGVVDIDDLLIVITHWSLP